MHKVNKKLTPSDISHATTRSSYSVKAALKLAEKYKEDPEKELRLKDRNCLVCFYSPTLAMQAFHDTNCGICDKPLRFSSSDTDAMCLDCSTKHDLCKKCGCDMNLDSKRKVSL